MPILAANSSLSKEELIGNFVEVIVHPAIDIEREDRVVTSL